MLGRLRQLAHQITHPCVQVAKVSARHIEHSMLFSADDDLARTDDFLLDLAVGAASEARHLSMREVTSRMKEPPYYPDIWPGEHYKLLAALVRRMQPRIVVEIGTYTGMSALAIMTCLPKGGKLITLDILPWNTIPDTLLTTADFDSGQLEQIIGNLADPLIFARYLELLQSADLIFVDGPKDGQFEDCFLANMAANQFLKELVLVFDDIRLLNMLQTWRGISRPKLDLTSFGHWSGTGLVHWASG